MLSLTFLMMAAGSVIIGITPDYQAIGIIAPIIVIVARMVQGFSAGAELGSASVFVAEQVPRHRRGYYLGYISMATLGTTLISAAIGLMLNHLLGRAIMSEWGWRLPFLFGAFIAPVGIYVRRQLPESHVFSEAKASLDAAVVPLSVPRVPIQRLLGTMGGFVSGAAVNYLTLVYMPTYLNHELGVPIETGFTGALIASGLVAILLPVVGHWSDVYGRRKILIASNILLALLSYPLFVALQASPVLVTIVIVQCVFAVLLALIVAPMVALGTEMFPTIGRSTGMSLGTALPLAVFGTCAPLIVTWLMMVMGNNLAPAFYLILSGAIATLGLLLIDRSPRQAI